MNRASGFYCGHALSADLIYRASMIGYRHSHPDGQMDIGVFTLPPLASNGLMVRGD